MSTDMERKRAARGMLAASIALSGLALVVAIDVSNGTIWKGAGSIFAGLLSGAAVLALSAWFALRDGRGKP